MGSKEERSEKLLKSTSSGRLELCFIHLNPIFSNLCPGIDVVSSCGLSRLPLLTFGLSSRYGANGIFQVEDLFSDPSRELLMRLVRGTRIGRQKGKQNAFESYRKI